MTVLVQVWGKKMYYMNMDDTEAVWMTIVLNPCYSIKSLNNQSQKVDWLPRIGC